MSEQKGWWLSVSQAADLLGVGRTRLYELIARGEIKVKRFGRAIRIPRGWLHEWAHRSGGEPTSPPVSVR